MARTAFWPAAPSSARSGYERRTVRGTEITQAGFSCTGDGISERLDRSGGVVKDRFFLANGGFAPTPAVHYGDLFTRPASGKIPVTTLPTPPPNTPTLAPSE